MAQELSVAEFFAYGMAAARETSEQRIRERLAGVEPAPDDADHEAE